MKTPKGKYGEEICTCGGHLTLNGAWIYNGRLYTDKFSFSCDKCHARFVCGADETETHQDVEEIKRLELQIEALKEKIKARLPNIV